MLYEKLINEWMEVRKAAARNASAVPPALSLFLNGFVADIKMIAKDAQREPTDEDVTVIAKKTDRGLREAREKAAEAGATEVQLLDYKWRLEALAQYLPQVASEEYTREKITCAINEGAKNVGDIMKWLKTNAATMLPLDMKLASALAKEMLG